MSTREVTEAELREAQRIGKRARNLNPDSPLYVRVLETGRTLHLLRWRAAGLQLSLTFDGGRYEDSYIYDAEQGLDEAGWRAALGWDGYGDPDGWYRHVQSGRRRPGGDATKEHIQP